VASLGNFSPIRRLFSSATLLKITEALSSTVTVYINIDKKLVWLHFGRLFLQTHLVTLSAIQLCHRSGRVQLKPNFTLPFPFRLFFNPRIFPDLDLAPQSVSKTFLNTLQFYLTLGPVRCRPTTLVNEDDTCKWGRLYMYMYGWKTCWSEQRRNTRTYKPRCSHK
jgi:hypothetical protein